MVWRFREGERKSGKTTREIFEMDFKSREKYAGLYG